MLDQELTPKEEEKDSQKQESGEVQKQEPEKPEPQPEVDIDPSERPPSELDKYNQQLEAEKEKRRIEYKLRKLDEDNRKMRKQLEEGGFTPPQETARSSDSFYDESAPQEDTRDKKFFEELEKKERFREVKDYVKDNPEYQVVGKSLEKFVNHPAYSKVPVDFIAKALSAEYAQRIGADKFAEAQKKAKMSQTGGHPFTPKEAQPKDYLSMPNEDFEKELAKIKRQERSQ